MHNFGMPLAQFLMLRVQVKVSSLEAPMFSGENVVAKSEVFAAPC